MSGIGHFFREAEPYIFQVLLGSVALFGLLKDWKDYDDASKQFWKPLRIVVLTVTIAVILLSIFETYSTRSEAKEKERVANQKEVASKKQIDDLTEQVSQEREENKHNADGFRSSFTALYNKYSELAARVQNADLLREIVQTRKELKVTQDKLTQPKAKLTASFWHPNISADDMTRETTVPRRIDGSVAFDIFVVNAGDVPALNGEFTVRICDGCKYAKEPEGFNHWPGSSEQDRQYRFQHILPHVGDPKHTIEVIPPPFSTRFQVDIVYGCETCIGSRGTLKESLWVNVQ